MTVAVLLRESTRLSAGSPSSPLMDPFDEYALEAALRLRDEHPETVIKAFSVGAVSALSLLRIAASLGIDELTRYAPAAAQPGADDFQAAIQAGAVAEGWDFLLVGRDTSEWIIEEGWAFIAGSLGWPVLTDIQRFDLVGSRLAASGVDDRARLTTYHVSAPCLVTIAKGPVTLRKPDLKGIMAGRRKVIRTESLAPTPRSRTLEVSSLEAIPTDRKRQVLVWASSTDSEKQDFLQRLLGEV